MTDLDEFVAKERHRRLRLKNQRRPMHWWQERGDAEPPAMEHWCDECACFFGVPHENIHVNQFTKAPQSCRNVATAMHGNRQCACIECVCAEQIYGQGSLRSRITTT